MQQLPLDQIGYDPEYYPRVNGREDWLTVHRYKEALRAHAWKADSRKDGAFPPVVVVKTVGYEWPYLLLDGLHRQRAFGAAGVDKIWANVETLPKSKWLARSVELNIDGKRPLESTDKRWVATKLTAEGWKPGEIASLLCMERGSFDKLVATGIQKLTKASAAVIPTGRSNRQIDGEHIGFLKAPFVGLTGTGNAQKALRAQASVTAREAAQIIESFIALLESKAVDVSDERISGLLTRAEELLRSVVVTA